MWQRAATIGVFWGTVMGAFGYLDTRSVRTALFVTPFAAVFCCFVGIYMSWWNRRHRPD